MHICTFHEVTEELQKKAMRDKVVAVDIEQAITKAIMMLLTPTFST